MNTFVFFCIMWKKIDKKEIIFSIKEQNIIKDVIKARRNKLENS
ncbi:hypothetical protein MHTCC0001_37120 [Flavobacteriaceae bacterium MHTCC 0001]